MSWGVGKASREGGELVESQPDPAEVVHEFMSH